MRFVSIRFAFVGARPLLDYVRQLATDRKPWADRVWCSYADYDAAGLYGAHACVQIVRPVAGPWKSDSMRELAAHAKGDIHVVELHPDRYMESGKIVTADVTEG